jgi:hypothetical protein
MLKTEVRNAEGVDWDNERQVAQTRFRWIVEIEVSGNLVMDGFDLTDDAELHDRLCRWMPFAYGHELAGRVLKAPPPELVRKVQGYTD